MVWGFLALTRSASPSGSFSSWGPAGAPAIGGCTKERTRKLRALARASRHVIAPAIGIDGIQQIIIDICVEIDASSRPYRIGLHKPPEGRGIYPGAEIIEPIRLRVDARAGIAEAPGGRLALAEGLEARPGQRPRPRRARRRSSPGCRARKSPASSRRSGSGHRSVRGRRRTSSGSRRRPHYNRAARAPAGPARKASSRH